MTGRSVRFTPDQQAVIDHRDGHLQVIACAGSGKTEVIARRIAALTDPDGAAVAPRGIVAFTFTEKAALELDERVRERILARDGDPPDGLAEMYVGTIHGFCLDFLKDEVPEFLRYEVLDDVRQTLLIDRHSRASGLTDSAALDGKSLRRYTATAVYKQALAVLREADVDAHLLEGNSVVEGLAAYRSLLRDKGYLDYSSMIEETVRAVENDPDVRERIAARVRHVVDEYQDVNPVQERLVRAFADLGASVCVVGDDDQTIYQWRGGDVENIIGFADRYPDVTTVRLQENFRSAAPIVDAAREFIAGIDHRLDKSMVAAGDPGRRGNVAALCFDDVAAESAFVAARARELHGVAHREKDGRERGLCWSDMAVLLRSVRNDAAPIVEAMRAAGVPAIVTGMNDLFEAAEAEAARDLFHYLAGRLDIDEAALEGTWRRAAPELSRTDLRHALRTASEARAVIADDPPERRHLVYNLQRTYLDFLAAARLRESALGDRGELVYANLGRFSQLISDFETIHFHTAPAAKYESFSYFLEYGASGAYAQGDTVEGSIAVDAVRIMTVHQAKGLEWPVVFLPALRRNRFPAPRAGGRNLWHLLPEKAVAGHERYRGGPDDERRLFYVAMTRSREYLHVTWAPHPDKTRQRTASDFWDELSRSPHVADRPLDVGAAARLAPVQRVESSPVRLSFTDLKYLLECGYQYKLRALFGFNPPLHEALGFGKSLHDMLADVHARAVRGETVDVDEAASLVRLHLRIPYAYPALREKLRAGAERIVSAYLRDNASTLDEVLFREKPIEVDLGDGVSLAGRIDLVRRCGTDEIGIVDLKTNARSQAEHLTDAQLRIYALGYRQMTGEAPGFIETYDLDRGRPEIRELDEGALEHTFERMREVASVVRDGRLEPAPAPERCRACDSRGLCEAGTSLAGDAPRRAA